MTRLELAEQFSEASHQWAENITAGNWMVAGYWAHVAFERFEELQNMGGR